MKHVLGVLALFFMAMIAPVSAAKTIEVKSENFVLIGSVSENDGKALVTEIEQYRQAILQMLGVTPSPEPIKVRIYTAKNKAELEMLTGRTGIAGIYTTTLDGPIFILNSQKGFRRGKQARHIALHEYTHHLIAAYTDEVYPRWYNEGLANYFSTFEVDKTGNLIIGRPYQAYGYALSAKKWMPMATVVGAIRKYPYSSGKKSGGGLGPADFFYAQSWLAVHYILTTLGEPAKMRDYMNLLNSGKPQNEAFEKGFGRTPAEFHSQLKGYYRANKYKTVTIKPNVSLTEIPLEVKVLSKGEAAFHKAEAMRFFSGANVKTAEIEAQYNKAEGLLGETPAIIAARADLRSWEDDYEGAQILYTKALTQAPKDEMVNLVTATVLIYKYEKGENNKANDIKQARKHLMQALRANPDNVGAHYLYAKSFQLTGDMPSGQALASAETALDYYRSINFVDSNLMLASLLIKGGKDELARPVIDKAIIWGHSPRARSSARRMRKSLMR